VRTGQKKEITGWPRRTASLPGNVVYRRQGHVGRSQQQGAGLASDKQTFHKRFTSSICGDSHTSASASACPCKPNHRLCPRLKVNPSFTSKHSSARWNVPLDEVATNPSQLDCVLLTGTNRWPDKRPKYTPQTYNDRRTAAVFFAPLEVCRRGEHAENGSDRLHVHAESLLLAANFQSENSKTIFRMVLNFPRLRQLILNAKSTAGARLPVCLHATVSFTAQRNGHRASFEGQAPLSLPPPLQPPSSAPPPNPAPRGLPNTLTAYGRLVAGSVPAVRLRACSAGKDRADAAAAAATTTTTTTTTSAATAAARGRMRTG
jgi:hypothetical protein